MWDKIKKAVNTDLNEPLNYLMWINDLAMFGKLGYVYNDINILSELASKSKTALNHKVARNFLLEGIIQSNSDVGEYFSVITGDTTGVFDGLATIEQVANSVTATTSVFNSEIATNIVFDSEIASNIIFNSEIASNIVFSSTSLTTRMFDFSVATDRAFASNVSLPKIASSMTAITKIGTTDSLIDKLHNNEMVLTALNNSPYIQQVSTSNSSYTAYTTNYNGRALLVQVKYGWQEGSSMLLGYYEYGYHTSSNVKIVNSDGYVSGINPHWSLGRMSKIQSKAYSGSGVFGQYARFIPF